MHDEMTRAWSFLFIGHQDFTKYTTNEAMTVDIPANKKFVSCFIAYLGFKKKASDGEGLAYEGSCWGFTTPCFVLLALRLICPFVVSALLSFPRSWPYDFTFSRLILLISPEK